MEEKYFYDLLEQVSTARHDALEAVNEHHIIELIIKDAEGFPRTHENFPIKVEGLGEYTSHHLDEEEEDIFPLARKLFSEADLNTLGELFEEARRKLLDIELPEVPSGIDTSGSAAQ
jgi:hemerythrin-like domain-containing protein